jgi:hypothetical protein
LGHGNCSFVVSWPDISAREGCPSGIVVGGICKAKLQARESDGDSRTIFPTDRDRDTAGAPASPI